EDIRGLPPTGAVDQFVDSTDALGDRRLLRAAISVRLGTLSTGSRPKPADRQQVRQRYRHDFQAPRLPRPPRPDPERNSFRVAGATRWRIHGFSAVVFAQRQVATGASRRLRDVHRPVIS